MGKVIEFKSREQREEKLFEHITIAPEVVRLAEKWTKKFGAIDVKCVDLIEKYLSAGLSENLIAQKIDAVSITDQDKGLDQIVEKLDALLSATQGVQEVLNEYPELVEEVKRTETNPFLRSLINKMTDK